MQGENAKKRSKIDKQWWGKRPLSGKTVYLNRGMKFWKRLLHKIERRGEKVEHLKEL